MMRAEPAVHRAQRSLWRGALVALLLAPLAILWLGNVTDIDLALADAMFDPAAGRFPWEHAWLAERFSHVLLKRALVGLGLLFIALAIYDLWRPRGWHPVRRWQVRTVALSAALVPAAIALLKQASASHCPWDLARYGGSAPYVRLLQALPDGVAAGHCLPAGHASSALWLMACAVFWLPARPRAALAVLSATMALGLAVGWLQQLRGAHFLTHTLWSLWIAATLIVTIARLLARRLPCRAMH